MDDLGIIREYDAIKLKDGRTGAVVDAHTHQQVFLVDIDLGPNRWDNVFVNRDEIAEVTWRDPDGYLEDERRGKE